MTAINVIRQRDCVHVLSDGGAFSDGALVYQTAKIFAMPHLNAVVAFRGSPLIGPLFMFSVGPRVGTFDQLRATAPALVAELMIRAAPVVPSCEHLEFDCVVAGFSEADGPASYIISTHERYGAPGEVIDLGACGMTPTSPEVMAEFSERFPPGTSSEDIEAERDGLSIVEMQRRHHPGLVGGFVQLTTITRESITTRILRIRHGQI